MATCHVFTEGLHGDTSGGRDPVRCSDRCMRQRSMAESCGSVAGNAAVALADDAGSQLVVWNMTVIFSCIGNFIIPIDELIFFRGIETTNQNQTYGGMGRCDRKMGMQSESIRSCWFEGKMTGHLSSHQQISVI